MADWLLGGFPKQRIDGSMDDSQDIIMQIIQDAGLFGKALSLSLSSAPRCHGYRRK